MSTVLRIVMHFPGHCKEEDARRAEYAPHGYRRGSVRWAQRVRFSLQDTVHLIEKRDEGTVEIMLTKLLPEKFLVFHI